MSEVEMWEHVIDTLHAQQWATHQERKVKTADGTWKPDLVAVKVDSIAVFEGAPKLTAEKIAQALRWKRFAHFCYVVCAHPGDPISAEHDILRRACKVNRLGLMYVKPSPERGRARIVLALVAGKNTDPLIDPICDSLSRGMALEEKAGMPSPRGRRYAERCDEWAPLGDLVEKQPGIAWTEAARELQLDKTERTEAQRLILRGQMPRVQCNVKRSPWQLYPNGGGE